MKKKLVAIFALILVFSVSVLALTACEEEKYKETSEQSTIETPEPADPDAVDTGTQEGGETVTENPSEDHESEDPDPVEDVDPEEPEASEDGESEQPSTPEGSEDEETEEPDDFEEVSVTVNGVTYTSVNRGAAFEVENVSAQASTTLVIPEFVEGLPVIGIAKNAFSTEYEPLSIVLPDTLEYIRGNQNINEVRRFATRLDGVYYLGNEQNPYLAVICFAYKNDLWQANIHSDTKVITEGAFATAFVTSFDVASGNEHFVSVDGVLYDKELTTLIAYPICSERTSFTIPDSVSVIAHSAFMSGETLTEIVIPDGVTEIGYCAFSFCSNIKTLTIGSRLNTIGAKAFAYCHFENVTVAENNPYIKSVDNVIYSKDGTKLISYRAHTSNNGSFTVPDGVNVICAYAFNGSSSVKEIILPDGITTIEEGAFAGCSHLKQINIPDGVTTIGSKAFRYCYALTGIVIPDSVTVIGEQAFMGCMRLTNVTLSKNITAIKERTFANCLMTSIDIPYGVTEIGDAAFGNCGALTSVVIPDSVTTIGKIAFTICYMLEEITLPASVTELGSRALGNVPTVHYDGTIAQWNAVKKTDMLFHGDPAVRTIICTDGNIEVEVGEP